MYSMCVWWYSYHNLYCGDIIKLCVHYTLTLQLCQPKKHLQAVKVLPSQETYMCRQHTSYPHKEPVQVTHTRNLSKLPTQGTCPSYPHKKPVHFPSYPHKKPTHCSSYLHKKPVHFPNYPHKKPIDQSSVQVTHKRNNNYFLYVHIPTHQTSQDKAITSSREEELEVSCLYIPLCCMQSKVNCNAIVLVTQFVVLQVQLPLKLSKRMRRLFPYLVSIHIHVLMYYMSGM